MKITKVVTGEKRSAPAEGESVQDFSLYLFRTPVIFSVGGADRVFSGSTAIIYSAERRQFFRGAAGKGLKYDLICFRPTSGDRQYMGSMNIPIDTPIELGDDFVIASAIKNLSIQMTLSGKRKTELGELYMRIILISLEASNNGADIAERSVPRYPQLKRIREEIYDDPMRDWTVDEMCRRLAVSRTYFHRIYLDAFGVTFRQDVIESRMVYAAELLRTTELSVNAVAEKCGYESDSYFMRQFKQHRGCTPSEYRLIDE